MTPGWDYSTFVGTGCNFNFASKVMYGRDVGMGVVARSTTFKFHSAVQS